MKRRLPLLVSVALILTGFAITTASALVALSIKEHISINRLTGLKSVRRQAWGTITVTPAMLAGLPATLAETCQTLSTACCKML